ncbi:DsbA family oxidoreductase [Ornithinibacillus halophilus]|uniref:Predicted dithiol-disulfide isomerase, DsbA family n=1 Tax=Ornithinibacillus halophilus TaxID=930117 RepID=A0A1M5H1I9_9BACI|nr:DsbA family oxidoreductase [Ornithinibacillus halophilus]SHG09766.1 Predicted dithiol-disulfide isomerase, DsbA family [Ornithinibacillus halophilus]
MKIEVWSDFVCPFCYIGKRRLEAALNNFENKDNVTVEYRSYELDPNAEVNPGKSIHELLAGKYGMSVEKAKAMNENVGLQAKEVGLTYHFDTMKHTNTFDAHRLAQYADGKGKGKEMTERLLYAYFTESKLLSDHQTLIELAEEVGLDAEEVEEMLKTDEYGNKVRFDENQAKQIGVQGVPFFVFNEKYAVSGAQPVETFKEVLDKVWEEENEKPVLKSLNPNNSKTTYCTDEGCNIEEE